MILEATMLAVTYAGVRWYEARLKPKRYGRAGLVNRRRKPLRIAGGAAIIESPNAPPAISELPTKDTDIITFNRDKLLLSVCTLGTTLTALYFPVLLPVSVGLIIASGLYPMKKTEILLRQGKIRHETAVSTIYVFGLLSGQFVPVAIGGFFYQLGQRLANNAKNYSKHTLLAVVEHVPSSAWIEIGENEIEIPIADLKLENRVVVGTGETIPVDGRIFFGDGLVDQRALTGEAQPAEKQVGDFVYAGTILITGRIKITIEKAGQETSLARINHILAETLYFKPKTVLQGEALANQLALPLLAVAGGTAIILSSYGMLVILNSSIGNLVTVLGSIHTLGHLNKAAKAGILVKEGQGLEDLKNVDTVFFDKTGTLTDEEPTVVKTLSLSSSLNDRDILGYAAAAEQKIRHPIARALVNAATAAGLTLPPVEDSDYHLGSGIRATIEGKRIEIGSARFMGQRNIQITTAHGALMRPLLEQGNSLILVAIDRELAGIVVIHATLRPEAQQTIRALRNIGIQHIAIISGDSRFSTESIADKLGLDASHHEILPEQKSAIVKQWQAEGHHVCFVGDGINDAIAMKQADVSISMKGAASLATDSAQIILLDGSLKQLGAAFKISRDLDRHLKRSLNSMMLTLGANIIALYTLGTGLLTAIALKNLVFFKEVSRSLRPNSGKTAPDRAKRLRPPGTRP